MTANFQENKKQKMSKQMGKSFRYQLSKMKIPHKHFQSRMRSCKYPRTLSFSINNKEKENESDDVTLSDIDEFLFENFRTLFQTEYEEAMSRRDGAKTMSYLLESESEFPKLLDPPLENIRGSSRFFVPSGSSSSLITDNAGSSSFSSTAEKLTVETGEEEDDTTIRPDDFIALLTYSSCPYDDFRKSMQEMVEARLEHNGKVDWDFMEKLLFCYLDLNNKKSYRFILRAFVDLIVVLRENSGRVPGQ